YANGAFIAGAQHFPPRWVAEAEAFRAAQGARAKLDLRYGPAERDWLDLFLPEGRPRGLMVFIHGGYWLRFGPRDWSHLAQGALDRGWAVAMPAYTLAPEARITEMTAQIGRAISHAAGQVAGPIVVTGHSAGGHLSARMACTDAPLPEEVAVRLVRAVPISP
ncbi:alpha/beta hydrolase, partial [Thioclava sp. BHET1]